MVADYLTPLVVAVSKANGLSVPSKRIKAAIIDQNRSGESPIVVIEKGLARDAYYITLDALKAKESLKDLGEVDFMIKLGAGGENK